MRDQIFTRHHLFQILHESTTTGNIKVKDFSSLEGDLEEEDRWAASSSERSGSFNSNYKRDSKFRVTVHQTATSPRSLFGG